MENRAGRPKNLQPAVLPAWKLVSSQVPSQMATSQQGIVAEFCQYYPPQPVLHCWVSKTSWKNVINLSKDHWKKINTTSHLLYLNQSEENKLTVREKLAYVCASFLVRWRHAHTVSHCFPSDDDMLAIQWFIRVGHLAVGEAFPQLSSGTDLRKQKPWMSDTETVDTTYWERQCLSDICYHLAPKSHRKTATANGRQGRIGAGRYKMYWQFSTMVLGQSSRESWHPKPRNFSRIFHQEWAPRYVYLRQATSN